MRQSRKQKAKSRMSRRAFAKGLRVTLLSVPCSLLLVLSACHLKKVTYPSSTVALSLQKLCSHDYKMTNVETHLHGNTLQAYFWRVGMLKANATGDPSEIQPSAVMALENVLQAATRIALSTDAPIQFLEIKMADVLTGSTVTLWRYVPDIRDEMYTRMGEEEYLNRLVMDVDPDGQRAGEDRTVHWNPPITLEQFLALQVALRARRQSPVGLQVRVDLSEPKTLGVVIDNWSSIEKQDPGQEQKVADVVEKTARLVLRGYGYNGFHGLVMEDAQGLALHRWSL
jgi:hypothetical protein